MERQIWGIGTNIEKASFISFSKYRKALIKGPHVCGLYLLCYIKKLLSLGGKYMYIGTLIKTTNNKS